MTLTPEAVVSWWAHQGLPSPSVQRPVAVAFSAGVDSVVLLHLLVRTWPGAVVAIHVNHGLQEAASAFESLAMESCRAWQVPLRVVPVRVTVCPGDSLEEQARDARYAALASQAHDLGAQTVCLAHHAEDQAETVLLALARGAGLPGLAGMPGSVERAGIIWARPMLQVRKAAVLAYAHEQQLQYAVDPMNTDTRLARTRLRHEVLPSLAAVFPAVVDTIGRSARHCAQGASLLREYAEADLQAVGTPPRIAVLQQLSVSRQINVLRHWLIGQAGRAPAEAQITELVKQLGAARTRGHRIEIKVGAGRIVRTGAVIQYEPPGFKA